MRITIQTQPLVLRFGAKKAYRMIQEAGFEAVDWGLDLAWNSNVVKAAKEFHDLCIFEKGIDAALEHYAEELACMQENRLAITQAHAPGPAFVKDGYALMEYAIGIYREMIRFCQRISCGKLIIHGVSLSLGNYITAEECEQLNDHLFESLISVLQETDVKVCIENVWMAAGDRGNYDIYSGQFTDPREAREMVDRLNEKAGKECFGICLDTGHLHMTRNRFSDYIPAVGKRILALHIHDNMQNYDSHLMPYAGSIRWNEFLQALHDVGYDQDLNFETCGMFGAPRMPEELVPSFLRTIYKEGVFFRDKIQGK